MSEAIQKYFGPQPKSVKLARDFATATLNNWGLDAPLDDIRTCVSEMVSNALTHGTKCGRGVLVRLTAEDNWVRVEVHDSRSRNEREDGPRVRHPTATETSGRGLLIVDALADAWGVEDRQSFGKVVWSCFKSGPSVPRSNHHDQAEHVG